VRRSNDEVRRDTEKTARSSQLELVLPGMAAEAAAVPADQNTAR